VPLSLLNPQGRNPYILAAFWGNREFRDGSKIRGIREKIAKAVRKRAVAGEFRPQRGLKKVTDNGELGTLEDNKQIGLFHSRA